MHKQCVPGLLLYNGHRIEEVITTRNDYSTTCTNCLYCILAATGSDHRARPFLIAYTPICSTSNEEGSSSIDYY